MKYYIKLFLWFISLFSLISIIFLTRNLHISKYMLLNNPVLIRVGTIDNNFEFKLNRSLKKITHIFFSNTINENEQNIFYLTVFMHQNIKYFHCPFKIHYYFNYNEQIKYNKNILNWDNSNCDAFYKVILLYDMKITPKTKTIEKIHFNNTNITLIQTTEIKTIFYKFIDGLLDVIIIFFIIIFLLLLIISLIIIQQHFWIDGI